MKYGIHKLALAAALAASAGSVFAQQQPNGRDSVYADPAEAARPSIITANTAVEVRAGRDSVYATASTLTTPVAADATAVQQYGRGTVYAIQLDHPAGDISGTRTARAPSDRSTN